MEDEFLRLASREYGQVANLVNSQSVLGNCLLSSSSSASSSLGSPASALRFHKYQRHPPSRPSKDPFEDDDDDSSGSGSGGGSIDSKLDAAVDPERLESVLKQRDLSRALADYFSCTNAVRNTHAAMASAATSTYAPSPPQPSSRPPRRRRTNSHLEEEQSRHVLLSSRVLRSVTAASSGGLECGALHVDGLVRTAYPSVEDRHEENVVALAALKAGVGRFKREVVEAKDKGDDG